MQEAIINAKGVPPLLTLIRLGSVLGQEHAARTVWHLAALLETQGELLRCGAVCALIT